MIIYIHIPKCSGSSFKECFSHNFKDTFWDKRTLRSHIDTNLQYMLAKKKKIKIIPEVLADHFPHGIHEIFDTDDYKYITILRNPIERFISNFYYLLLNEPDSLFIKTFRNNKNNIIKTLKQCICDHINNNQMVKQLSGFEPLLNIILSENNKKDCVYYRGTHANIEPYSDSDMKVIFIEARRNISKYSFIGFQENSNKDYKRFCKQFNLKYKETERIRHTDRNIFKIDWNNVKINNLVRELNKYDMILYSCAKKIQETI